MLSPVELGVLTQLYAGIEPSALQHQGGDLRLGRESVNFTGELITKPYKDNAGLLPRNPQAPVSVSPYFVYVHHPRRRQISRPFPALSTPSYLPHRRVTGHYLFVRLRLITSYSPASISLWKENRKTLRSRQPRCGPDHHSRHSGRSVLNLSLDLRGRELRIFAKLAKLRRVVVDGQTWASASPQDKTRKRNVPGGWQNHSSWRTLSSPDAYLEQATRRPRVSNVRCRCVHVTSKRKFDRATKVGLRRR